MRTSPRDQTEHFGNGAVGSASFYRSPLPAAAVAGAGYGNDSSLFMNVSGAQSQTGTTLNASVRKFVCFFFKFFCHFLRSDEIFCGILRNFDESEKKLRGKKIKFD